jgi:hypothetical protein
MTEKQSISKQIKIKKPVDKDNINLSDSTEKKIPELDENINSKIEALSEKIKSLEDDLIKESDEDISDEDISDKIEALNEKIESLEDDLKDPKTFIDFIQKFQWCFYVLISIAVFFGIRTFEQMKVNIHTQLEENEKITNTRFDRIEKVQDILIENKINSTNKTHN